MKRFLVFSADSYYPAGGWRDFIGSFDTQQEAEDYAIACKRDWWHVVDTERPFRILASQYENGPIERA